MRGPLFVHVWPREGVREIVWCTLLEMKMCHKNKNVRAIVMVVAMSFVVGDHLVSWNCHWPVSLVVAGTRPSRNKRYLVLVQDEHQRHHHHLWHHLHQEPDDLATCKGSWQESGPSWLPSGVDGCRCRRKVDPGKSSLSKFWWSMMMMKIFIKASFFKILVISSNRKHCFISSRSVQWKQ